MKKKILSLLVATTMCLSTLVGCASGENEKTRNDSPKTTEQSSGESANQTGDKDQTAAVDTNMEAEETYFG